MYFCYIDDVVEAYFEGIRLVCTKDLGFNGKYSVRTQTPIALRDFVEKYLEYGKKNVHINWGGRPYMNREIMDPIGYGKTLPGWTPKIDYDEGIKRCAIFDDEISR